MNNSQEPNITPKDAIAQQTLLSKKVIIRDDFGEVRVIAGVDVHTRRGYTAGKCGIVVLSFPELELIESVVYEADITFPYIPGLLGFREIPIVMQTYGLLRNKPDMLFMDGQGFAHPRRLGLACHAGVLLDIPAIGCAKSRLIGVFEEPGLEAGCVSTLMDKSGERIGDVVRTKTSVKPIFVSPGHRVDFETATRLALACTRGYRIPEPTRQAHILVSGK